MKMTLMLKEDIHNLGITRDVVDVAAGYARNYLLPQGLAMPVNASTQQAIAKAKKERDAREAARKGDMEALAERIRATPVTVHVPVSDAGTLYSAVSPSQMSAALAEAGVDGINEGMVRLEAPIKALGEHTVRFHLHPEVDAELAISVVADETAEPPKPQGEGELEDELDFDRDDLYGQPDDDDEDERPRRRRRE